MNIIIKQILSGLLAGALTASTAITALLVDVPLMEVTDGQWLTIGLGGFIAAGAGWRTLLSTP